MMSRNDARQVGHPEEPASEDRGRSSESERLEQPGAGARVTGVHGVGAPDVTDHDVPASDPDEDGGTPPIDNGAGS
jgi:hypothetical protein